MPPMALPYELLIGLRYTRAKRRNHFISFISLISMLGIALGVAALIVVLSVMNGFQTELRSRILAVVSHVQISGASGEMARLGSASPKQAERTAPVCLPPRPSFRRRACSPTASRCAGRWCAASCPTMRTRWPTSDSHMKEVVKLDSLQPDALQHRPWFASWRVRSASSSATR
jgi:lipoprotein-releasing system permease protein